MALEVLAESFDLMSPVPGITRASKSTSEATSLSTRLRNMSITEYELEDVEEIDSIWYGSYKHPFTSPSLHFTSQPTC